MQISIHTCLSNIFPRETQTKTTKVTILFFVTINHDNHFHIIYLKTLTLT